MKILPYSTIIFQLLGADFTRYLIFHHILINTSNHFTILCGPLKSLPSMRPRSVRRARIAAEARKRAEELRIAEQFKEELRTNPALRRKMQPGAHQQLEIQRDIAFQRMEDSEQHRIYGLRSLSQQIAAHKLFWKWREQALLELRRLRETERLDQDDCWIFTMLDDSADIATILPVTTPAAFASQQQQQQQQQQQKQQHTGEKLSWFRSAAGGPASSLGCPPGKRFSVREMSQNGCKTEHYRWLKESVATRFTKVDLPKIRVALMGQHNDPGHNWRGCSGQTGLAASRTGKDDDCLQV